ncbi:Stk1 family PASTA domain-containing Ser/Thr kinase [Pontibacillus marinus]|uniref:Serine/threonine-protein kinase PrkC n=1 Tax=Pontibacillus marinus BH030004 = DSM 16465 TaxID=1385511 RepID=A0A0A5HQ25_9BACI|nr:Stk1 family PASTA domain-containing Ser/Thr kinase [Pontibacillus marinus]KGX85727.1 serine/threonine protein kinase [Pontibacillus marinus BH030004 = DSM 16465]
MLNGHLLNDRYEIRETIGGGGMANVYVARDTILNRDVAIKVLRLEYANDDEFIARFRREAHSATSLSHPNIVNIYDVGEEEHIYYMVMEYVDGMTLKQYIQTYGPLEVEESLEITKQITAAITHAHDNDIIHRDIKPQNILIDEHKQVKVTDFGIAMALSATSLTQTNSVLGSVHYLSPEQARGGMATKKSDIYSIGIVMFEMLTGRLPFSGQSAVSIALKHLQSETPSLKRWNPDTPQSVENVVLKATAKDPFHRYNDVHDMVEDLEKALHPSRQNEEKFVIPVPEDEEVTKAIPVITNDMYKEDGAKDETIIHNTDHSSFKNENKENKAKKSFRWKPWLIGLLLFVVAAGIAGLFFLPKLLIPKDVQVEDVSGMEYADAFEQLSEQNLEVRRESIHSNEVKEGYVIKTDPAAGTTIKEGARVTVFSSLGKERVKFDDYVGQTFSQVKKLLEGKGYSVIKYTMNNPDIPKGEIIRQTEPNPGEMVIPENTTVIFEVSDGPKKVTLRDLTGKTLEEVYNVVGETNNISLKEPKYEFSETVPEGEVIRQKPEPYAQVTPGTEVEVWVSKGMKEKPPVNKVVTFTIRVNENQDEDDKEKPEKHKVKIYIGDMNRDITEVAREEKIRESTQYNLNLTIPAGGEARYKVMLDDTVVKEEVVPYEEGENE